MADAGNLRLLVVGVAWPPETFLANLLSGLLRAGMQITLANSQKPSPSWLSRPGFTWLRLPGWGGSPAGKLARMAGPLARSAFNGRGDLRVFSEHVQQAKRLKDRLALWDRLLPFAGRRWDFIYFPWNSAAIDYWPLFDLGVPVVISCRGAQINVAPHNPARASIRAGLQKTFDKASAVHCVSDAILQEASVLGLDRRKARVIRSAVDIEYFTPASAERWENQSYHIVTTGALIWRKGYEYALAAVRALKDRRVPVHFEIIGSGPERQRLLYSIHDLELVENVSLAGRLPPEEVSAHLQQADVFLLTSLSEGLSNAALEAMACGLPVVTTDCGGMREAVTDSVEGLVVPPRDAQALASALHRLWQNPGLREQMGKAGRKRILTEFTLDQQIDGFVRLFQSAARSLRGE